MSRAEDQITRIIVAYLLDRADQYETDSPCWVGLVDAASNIMNGEPNTAYLHGEFDADLFKRVDQMKRQAVRPVNPRAGVDD